MQFPELHDYADLWPVTDMVRLSLKYTSGRSRLNDKVSRELSKRTQEAVEKCHYLWLASLSPKKSESVIYKQYYLVTSN